MEPSYQIEAYITQAKELLNQGNDIKKISESLADSGANEIMIETVIRQLKSVIYLKRRKRGFKLGVAGSILLMTGFILTVLFYHSGISIHYVMYGMTSLGVILLMAGLVELVGW
jgi:hypothetical protein